MDDLSDLKSDVKEIKAQVLELVKQGAVNTSTLIQHERRSTNLEDRFKPVEDSHIFVRKLGAVLLSLAAVLSAAGGLYKLLH